MRSATESGGGGNSKNEVNSSSQRRNRVVDSTPGKKRQTISRRGRSLQLSLLLVSLFLLLRRVIVKCGYLFPKPRDRNHIETAIEGRVPRLLASGGSGDEEDNQQGRRGSEGTPPSLSASLATCIAEDEQIFILNLYSVSPEGGAQLGQQATVPEESAASSTGKEEQGGGKSKRRTRHLEDEDGQRGASSPPRKVRTSPVGLSSAFPQLSAMLAEPSSSANLAGEQRSPALGSAQQPSVIPEFSDSQEETPPEPARTKSRTRKKTSRSEDVYGPWGEEGARPSDGDYLSRSDLLVDPEALSIFRQNAGPYITSIILDTPKKQEEWVKAITVVQARKNLVQALSRERRSRNKGSALCVFKNLLQLQFFVVRAVAVGNETLSPAIQRQLSQRLRAAQLAIEAGLLRIGMAPAFRGPAQTWLIHIVAQLCEPLNDLARERADRRNKGGKAPGAQDATGEGGERKTADAAFAQQLLEDKTAFVTHVFAEYWAPQLWEWLSRQPSSFRETLPRDCLLRRMMNHWSLLSDEPSSTETVTSSPDEPDVIEMDDLFANEEEPMDQEAVMRYAGFDYRPLGSLSELLPILRPLFVPAALPLNPEQRTRWRGRMEDLLLVLRHHVGSHLKLVRHREVRTPPGLTSLLASLATLDFTLCAARHAMEAVPELSPDDSLTRICTAAERSVYYTWSRLGFYRKATAWARKGLATVVRSSLTPARLGSRRDLDPGSLVDDIVHSVRHQLKYIQVTEQLADWMQNNPDPSVALDIHGHSRLFRHLFPKGLRWPVVVRAAPVEYLETSPPQPLRQDSLVRPSLESPPTTASASTFSHPRYTPVTEELPDEEGDAHAE
ncbi:hypothetical protein CSUI_000120 [Cystoisospora suis]|uniref:Transmembrane protein n=1 Tax=Cystoisospora suis TaxID=483139 RepID=A0A2C6LHM4_9APIC|nr:hypothetical protein CSUI_000120 [Cystoisospora suis]